MERLTNFTKKDRRRDKGAVGRQNWKRNGSRARQSPASVVRSYDAMMFTPLAGVMDKKKTKKKKKKKKKKLRRADAHLHTPANENRLRTLNSPLRSALGNRDKGIGEPGYTFHITDQNVLSLHRR